MRVLHSRVSIETLCGLFGKTRQAHHQKQKRLYKQHSEHAVILEAVSRVRRDMPRLGSRKLLVKLTEKGLDIGRDALFDLLRENCMLVRRKSRKARTTHSYHFYKKYPNLIKGLSVDGPEQVWASDITYIETGAGFAYLFLITDAYSRKIVGFKTAGTLEAKHAVEALKMAFKGLEGDAAGLIHHSDRGIQYCCHDYVRMLHANDIRISMTENGDPLENAIAERVNGILKVEWIYDRQFKGLPEAREYVKHIICVYNTQRPHSSIEMLTPQEAHQRFGKLQRKWKNYYAREGAG